MAASEVTLTLEKAGKQISVPSRRVHFSVFRCFLFEGRDDEARCLEALADHLLTQPGVVFYGAGQLFDALFEARPALVHHVLAVILDEADVTKLQGLPVTTPDKLPAGIETVFLCDNLTFSRMQKQRRMPSHLSVIGPDILQEIAPDIIPARAWTPMVHNIYPIEVPEIQFEKELDMILLDCPARNLALMPNGLGYVHNALKKTSIAFQTFDLDIVTYHRFQIRRLFDEGGMIALADGRELPIDPWQAEHYDLWSDDMVIDYFEPIMDEAVEALIAARPKILGLSIHACNESFSSKLAQRVKQALPETVIITGGFSCYNADIGRRGFPIADYMCIGEADLTVGPLVEALARGEQPRNQPGVISRYDSPNNFFVPAPMPHNLDKLDFPRYDWFDLSVYRNFNDYQLTPVIASRGCRWSRCTFCAERFYWRIRSANNFVNELEWLIDQGCTLFMFNESDLNGMPEKLLEICEEIIRRGIKVKLTGQLRIHNKSDRAFYQKLAEAGFVALRFGVDAFSQNTLKLQKKGYTVETISQNLKDCWEAGIYTEVNWVIGVPGETDKDVQEGIALILANQEYIGRLANINPLILSNGGVYWLEPEKHGIRFRKPQDELYAEYPRALPADQWYSVEPYIDAQVRKVWFEQIVFSLHEAGFPVGEWAARIIEDVRLARDRSRVGANVSETVNEIEPPEASWPETAPQATARADTAPDGTDNLIAELDTHKIVFREGQYIGLPLALGDVDLTDADLSQLSGVFTDDTEAGLRIQIEEALNWADSRGHYDSRQKQREAGSYMRVDSGNIDVEEVLEAPMDAKIVRFDGEYYAVDRGTLDQALQGNAPMASSADSDSAGHPQTGIKSGPPVSLLRRVAYVLLPEAIQTMSRRILAAQRFKRGKKEMLTDRERIIFLIGGLAHEIFGRRFGGADDRPAKVTREIVPGEGFAILNALTTDAIAELMCTVGEHNIVHFDGKYYCVPLGYAVCWTEGNIGEIPGIIVAESVIEAIRSVRERRAKDASSTQEVLQIDKNKAPPGNVFHLPWLLGSKDGYNIISYEGWIYGIPQSLGELDLTEIDIMEMPGVIRDVSRDTVELEITEISGEGREHVAVDESQPASPS